MLAAAPGGFEWATFSIAVVGAVSGLAAFGWRIYEWRASGPQVGVQTSGGITSFTPGTTTLVAIVEAVSTGRQPCQVTGAGLELEDGRTYVLMAPPGSTPLPATIQPGHEAKWLFPLAGLVQVLNDYPGADLRFKGFITGGGRRVRSKDYYAVAKSVIAQAAADGS